MSTKRTINNIETALEVAAKYLNGREDDMARPRYFEALALVRCARNETEAITGALYVAMSRGTLTYEKLSNYLLLDYVKDALRQLDAHFTDQNPDVLGVQIGRIKMCQESPSGKNREGAELAKVTLCHAVMCRERQMMEDLQSLLGNVIYNGDREIVAQKVDPGCRVSATWLEKRLPEVLNHKARLVREFGVGLFLE